MGCNCNKSQTTLALNEKPWQGTTLKFYLNPTATGFDAQTDDWEVEIRYGSSQRTYKTFKKTDLKESTDGWVLPIDTTNMNGLVRAIVLARLNDDDCDDGIRKEVCVVDLCELNIY